MAIFDGVRPMGLLASLLSAIFVTAKDTVSKSVSGVISASLSTFFSFACAVPYHIAALLLLWAVGKEDFTTKTGFVTYIILRALTDTLAEGLKMKSFAHANLSTVSAILSLTPVFLLVTSPALTGDIPSATGLVGVCVVVLGSILVVFEPRDGRSSLFGMGCAAGAAFFFSLNSALDRLAVQTSSPALAALAMAVLPAAFMLPQLLYRGEKIRMYGQAKPLWLRGFFEVLFMVSKLTALKYWQAPYVVSFQRTSVLFSVLTGKVFFNEKNMLRKASGAALIVAGSLLVAFS